MYLSTINKQRIQSSFEYWGLTKDFSDPLYHYLVFATSPGGFFTSLLANDCMTALGKSHPANSLEMLKNIAGWVINYMPKEAWGTYEKVEHWKSLNDEQRQRILEDTGLILTPQKETWATLKGDFLLDKNPYFPL